MRFDAVILAAGSSSRFSGGDKAELVIGGKRLLDRVVNAVAEAERVIVVGPRRRLETDVLWTEEEPPGGGPSSALQAGILQVRQDLVAVVSVDSPFLTPMLLRRLVEGVGAGAGAMLRDQQGRAQYLTAAYRTAVLKLALDKRGRPGGSVREVITGMAELTYLEDEVASFDCDTPEDLEEARRIEARLRRP